MSLNDLLLWLSALFVFAGAVVTLIAALGVLRLPDFFMRMHAATKAGVVGPSLILIGAGFFDPSWNTWIKVFLAILFLLTTTPIAAHLIGKAGFIAGVSLWGGTVRNDLKTVLPSTNFTEVDAQPGAEGAPADMMTDSPEASPNP